MYAWKMHVSMHIPQTMYMCAVTIGDGGTPKSWLMVRRVGIGHRWTLVCAHELQLVRN
jgi:hypothetical protein